jgi:hypothetical protein
VRSRGGATLSVSTQLLLHLESGIERTLRMVLIRGRCADNRTRLLGVEVLHQFGRALEVGEQRGDGLTLALG